MLIPASNEPGSDRPSRFGDILKIQIDAYLGRAAAAWVETVRQWPRVTAVVVLVATALCAAYTVLNLGVNTDGVKLIAEHLPSRKNHEAFAALFPNLENAILVVIDGATPELAREAADSLQAELLSRPDVFHDVYLPGGGRFFERNGLLYRSVEELDVFSDQLARMQPLVAELHRDPSIANVSQLARDGLEALRSDDGDGFGADDWPVVLDRISSATVAVYDEYPIRISWEQILLRDSSIDVVTRQILVVHADMDFRSFVAAAGPMRAIRDAAERLRLSDERGVRVRLTGLPAMGFEEIYGWAWDVGVAGIFCFAMVVVVLYRAMRSLAIVSAAVVTLLVGLVWTAGFAAATIGHLNLISIAFAVLFIGLGVDFQIHLGMAYVDFIRQGRGHREALAEAARDVGGAEVMCAFTSAIGFLVFVPTDYRGVAELGLIAGAGMFIILFLTLTIFPALLSSWLRVRQEGLRDLRFRHGSWLHVFERHSKVVLWAALLVAIGSLALLPRSRFDANAVKLRYQQHESVSTFNELLDEAGLDSPWFMNAVVDDLGEAERLARELDELDIVEQTVVLSDYVPSDQAEKLEILEDLSLLLYLPEPEASTGPPKLDADEQVAALRSLHEFFSAGWVDADDSPLGVSMRKLRAHLGDFLERVEREKSPDEALEALEDVLLGGFAGQIDRLRTALEATPVEIDDLPEPLVRRMLAPDGRARIQIYPRYTLNDEAAFAAFSDGVQELAPNGTGVATNMLAFGRATRRSFEQALASALVAIFVLLWLLWRRVTDVALVLLPLLLCALATGAAVVLLDIPWSFGNVLVIPLLLGIGVDSGIHLVHRWRHPEHPGDDLLGSTTARAVFYSALTTTVSFGSLGFSSHLGMRSLGIALAIGMTISVASNLVFLPALLRTLASRSGAAATRA